MKNQSLDPQPFNDLPEDHQLWPNLQQTSSGMQYPHPASHALSPLRSTFAAAKQIIEGQNMTKFWHDNHPEYMPHLVGWKDVIMQMCIERMFHQPTIEEVQMVMGMTNFPQANLRTYHTFFCCCYFLISLRDTAINIATVRKMMLDWIWTRWSNDSSKFSVGIIWGGITPGTRQPIPHCIGMIKVSSLADLKDFEHQLRKKHPQSKIEQPTDEESLGEKLYASILGINLALYKQYTTLSPFERDLFDKVSYFLIRVSKLLTSHHRTHLLLNYCHLTWRAA